MKELIVAVIDGQGGGLGAQIVSHLKPLVGENVKIYALGTNALATQNMLRAGADKGASGENAIVQNCARADLILGPIGIVLANSMLGEFTPRCAEAVASSPAHKLLIPLTACGVEVVGVGDYSVSQLIELLIQQALKILEELSTG